MHRALTRVWRIRSLRWTCIQEDGDCPEGYPRRIAYTGSPFEEELNAKLRSFPSRKPLERN